MAIRVDDIRPIVLDNINVEVLAITTDRLENKLMKLIPKVDHLSNWSCLVGILVSAIFGFTSYICDDTITMPYDWKFALMLIGTIVAIVFIGIIIWKGYKCLTPEQIIEEFKEGCTFLDKEGNATTYNGAHK